MEFDVNKVYTAVNANELKVGDKVILANDLDTLRKKVINDRSITCINRIASEEYEYRFYGKNNAEFSILAYLVERAKEDEWRPYKDTDEMIADFRERFKVSCSDYELPSIWVEHKISRAKCLITDFCTTVISMSSDDILLSKLFDSYMYLDGSPCGVEEE